LGKKPEEGAATGWGGAMETGEGGPRAIVQGRTMPRRKGQRKEGEESRTASVVPVWLAQGGENRDFGVVPRTFGEATTWSGENPYRRWASTKRGTGAYV